MMDRAPRRRGLATVLFTDIAGSTERAAELGDREWRRLLDDHHERVRRELGRCGGRVVTTAGDGFLASFEDPARAIACAAAIRSSLREIGLEIRCGLHMGEVEWSAGQMGGITVHIGARVAAHAKPGEILVSGAVRDAMVGSDFGFQDRGRHALKGVPGEWRVWDVNSVPAETVVPRVRRLIASRGFRLAAAGAIAALAGLAGFFGLSRTGFLAGDAAADPASIAVLPFDNIGADPESEYFSDGITDDIRAHLSKLGTLRVIGRSSVEPYRGTTMAPDEIGEDLGVEAILSGSVRRADERVRIVAELVDAETGSQLWTEIYDRTLEDVFVIQGDVARKIAAALKTELTPSEMRGIEARPTADLEAYQLYLKGRYFWNRRTREGLDRAVAYLQQAIEKDPGYARAYAGLADAYNTMGQWYAPPEDAFPRAKAAALEALAIDSTLAEPRVALGYIAMEYEWDWPAAERWLETAVKLDPGYSSGHQYYGNYLRIMGRFEEAIAQGLAALEIDPLSIPQQAELGYTYYYARRYGEARRQLARTLEMDSTYAHAHLRMGQVAEQEGRPAEAVAELERAVALSGDETGLQAALAHALALAGRPADASRILDRLLAREGFVSPYNIAIVYIALGEPDRAFEWLEKAYVARSPSMVSLRVHPWLDPLREDPRFAALLSKMKL